MSKKPLLSLLICVLLTPAAVVADPLPGGTLDPTTVAKYQAPLIVPPAMPRKDVITMPGGKKTDYYEIAVRQFDQQVLPPGLPLTTVWSYGAADDPASFNYPAFTLEAKYLKPVRVKWINDLVDQNGNYLPHLLPVDQTLHWANPPGLCKDGTTGTDCRTYDPMPYDGPVPMVVHVHGAETYEWADGYPEAWWLPAANDIPAGYFEQGSFYDTFKNESPLGDLWQPGAPVFEYPNEQRATTLWYHDHSLGMTRLNVYAGPAGFYLLRGGPDDLVLDLKGKPATLPGPAPALGDPPGADYYEVPIVIQDRSFDDDGSLFYPDNRAFFEGLLPFQLQIPFIPMFTLAGERSDVSPIWNPEFFGNTLVTNGRTWPYLDVEQRRYRLRFLNGCQSRFLILEFDQPLSFWQIGAEGGFLPGPIELNRMLVAPAERADTIVDFSQFPEGTVITLLNLGPDEPFGGGEPGVDFDPADPGTTGQVMQFRVVRRKGADKSTPPQELVLPAIVPYGPEDHVRQITLNEEESATVYVIEDEDGNLVEVPADTPGAEPFGPTEALLGTLNPDGTSRPLMWNDLISENPAVGDTEMWEIHNFTADAHPIHIHLVQFQVIGREDANGVVRPPEAWETGFKDTVIAYPDEITRVKARFNLAGLFVWHCHILEHEDNEMMRPYCVGTSAACEQHGVE